MSRRNAGLLHAAVGILFLGAYRYQLATRQLLAGHPLDLMNQLLAGFLFDLTLWLFCGFLLQFRGWRYPGLAFALVNTGLSLSNLAVSAHFKAGVVNFRFIFDYLGEITPLMQTGQGLLSLGSFFIFLLLPAVYWGWLFSFLPRRQLHSRPWQYVLAVFAMLALLVAEIVVIDRSQIIANNVFLRMVQNEYQAFRQESHYKHFATAMQGDQVYPEQAHFEKQGYSFQVDAYPLVKEPKKVNQQPARRPNIVIIIMESVSAKDTGFLPYTGSKGRNVTPFLTQLMGQSLIVPRFFANADYTAGAEVAIFCSNHDSLRYSVGSGSILRSYTYTNLLCLPEILKETGYHTSFYHSYTATFDRKHVFFPINGVDEVIDKDHEAFKGIKQTFWGIQDRVMFDLGARNLGNTDKPFFSIFLTVNNHPPYILHYEKDRRDFGESGTYGQYLNTVYQTDLAIKHFFDSIKDKPWYKNTIFIITSDNGVVIHPDKQQIEWHEEFKMWHMVPFLIFSPDKGFNFAGRVLDLPAASHIDVTPTILDLLGIKITNPFVGESLFARNRRNYTFVYDWFENYYRLSWPAVYHESDHRMVNLQSGKNFDHRDIETYRNWVRQSRSLYNRLIFRNRLWLASPGGG